MVLESFMTKLKLRKQPPLVNYIVRVQRKGDDYIAYNINVDAINPEDAKEKAFQFLFQNAWWPWMADEEWMRTQLTAVEIISVNSTK